MSSEYPYSLRFGNNSINPEFSLLSELDMIAWRLENYSTETEECAFYPNPLQRQYIDQYRKMAAQLVRDFCLLAYSEMDYLPGGQYWLQSVAPRIGPKPIRHYNQYRLTWSGITYPAITRALIEIYGMIFRLKHPDEVEKCIEVIQGKNEEGIRFNRLEATVDRCVVLRSFWEIYQKLHNFVHPNPLKKFHFLPLLKLTTLMAWLIDDSSVQNFAIASNEGDAKKQLDKLLNEL